MAKLTILCVACSGLGHVNTTLGVAHALRKRGHRVVFAAERSYKGKFEKLGFEELLFDEREKASESGGEQWAEVMNSMANAFKLPPEKQFKDIAPFFDEFLETVKYSYDSLTRIVEATKPNVIVEDFGFLHAALVTDTAPLVRLFSISPLFAWDDDRLPPSSSGLSLTSQNEWKSYREAHKESKNNLYKKVYDFLKSKNKIPNSKSEDDYIKCIASKNLNIYVYPKAVAEDYLKLCPLGNEWIGIDHSLREASGEFALPDSFKNKPGKLIFFSMGSMGSSVVELMQRLVNILSKSPHKFIVAKGHLHKLYHLADNMWGDAFVPQLDVLPMVDLVLTHGGNNSFVETLYFGKPMIVLPLYGDQHDNAQRAVELNIGLKLKPFEVDEKELLDAIENTLKDEQKLQNVKQISEQMQKSNSMELAVERIEYVAKHPIFPTI